MPCAARQDIAVAGVRDGRQTKSPMSQQTKLMADPLLLTVTSFAADFNFPKHRVPSWLDPTGKPGQLSRGHLRPFGIGLIDPAIAGALSRHFGGFAEGCPPKER